MYKIPLDTPGSPETFLESVSDLAACSDAVHFKDDLLKWFDAADKVDKTTGLFKERSECPYPKKCVVVRQKSGAFAVIHDKGANPGILQLQKGCEASLALVKWYEDKLEQAKRAKHEGKHRKLVG